MYRLNIDSSPNEANHLDCHLLEVFSIGNPIHQCNQIGRTKNSKIFFNCFKKLFSCWCMFKHSFFWWVFLMRFYFVIWCYWNGINCHDWQLLLLVVDSMDKNKVLQHYRLIADALTILLKITASTRWWHWHILAFFYAVAEGGDTPFILIC